MTRPVKLRKHDLTRLMREACRIQRAALRLLRKADTFQPDLLAAHAIASKVARHAAGSSATMCGSYTNGVVAFRISAGIAEDTDLTADIATARNLLRGGIVTPVRPMIDRRIQ